MPRFSPKQDARRTPWRLALTVLLATVLCFGVYAYFVMRMGVNWLFWVYLGTLLAASLGYVLYNRAFADAGATIDNLPQSMSYEEKQAFIAARDARKNRSRFLLAIIFPLAITLMFDTIYLFFGDMLVSLFDSFGKVIGIW